jgi:hypothetical protein
MVSIHEQRGFTTEAQRTQRERREKGRRNKGLPQSTQIPGLHRFRREQEGEEETEEEPDGDTREKTEDETIEEGPKEDGKSLIAGRAGDMAGDRRAVGTPGAFGIC